MEGASLLLTASVPDPKGLKTALLPFSVSRDGTLTTSTSGFAVLHGDQVIVLASAAAVYPLLPAARRTSLSGASHADLLPGVRLTATAFDDASNGAASTPAVELRLAALAEVPALRAALVQLLAAPSLAGPGGWQLGWLMQRTPLAAPSQQWQQQQSLAAPAAALPTAAMLEVASHLAVLQPASPDAAAALRRHAVPLPASSSSSWGQWAALRPGLPIIAVGAPFGSLAPGTFSGFQAGGVVAAAVPRLGSSSFCVSSSSASSGSSSSPPALLLADLRCSPGMEGCPVFAASQAAAQPGTPLPLPSLIGMLLPPLKAPAAAVEIALVAPIGAMAEAAASALGASSLQARSSSGGSSTLPPQAAAAAAAAAAAEGTGAAPVQAALPAVVAVSASGSWASGVLISSGGHILTNAHALQPALPIHQPDSSGSGPQLQLRPASAAAADAHTPVRVLLPGSGGGGSSWAAADVLYAFIGPLDLAVLRLRQPAGQQAPWQPARLSGQPPAPGQRVCVAGFPVFSPRASPVDGPLVTAGTLAKVMRLPSTGQPAMLLTSAAVHSGASGGACLDASTGELLGLVTSNAKHTQRPPPGSSGGSSGSGSGGGGSDGAGGAQVVVLPHLNFCIPAAQLAPVVAAAQAAAAAGPAGDAAALAAWQAIDEAALASAELQQAWHLDSQRPKQQQQQQQQQPEQPAPGGGAFGGARPPARLRQLLDELQRQQEQGQGQQEQQEQRQRAKL